MISWESAKWNATNMNTTSVSYDEICNPDKLGFTLFQLKLNFTAALSLCKASGGYLAYIRNQDDQESIENALKYSTECYSKSLIDHFLHFSSENLT